MRTMSERGSAPAAENKMGTMPVGKLVFNMSLANDGFYAGTGAL